MAATLAALIGAAVGGMAVKEVLEEVSSAPHTVDFKRALDAGSIILWVAFHMMKKNPRPYRF